MRRASPAIVLTFATLGIASESAGQDRDRILQVMTSAADWQLAHPSEHPPDDWTQAAFYTGMMALAQSTDHPKYADAMRAMGRRTAGGRGRVRVTPMITPSSPPMPRSTKSTRIAASWRRRWPCSTSWRV